MLFLPEDCKYENTWDTLEELLDGRDWINISKDTFYPKSNMKKKKHERNIIDNSLDARDWTINLGNFYEKM